LQQVGDLFELNAKLRCQKLTLLLHKEAIHHYILTNRSCSEAMIGQNCISVLKRRSYSPSWTVFMFKNLKLFFPRHLLQCLFTVAKC